MNEKTEDPTPKKLRDARNKGQVAKSKDFTQTVLLIALIGYFIGNGANILEDMMALMVLPAEMYGHPVSSMIAPISTEIMNRSIGIIVPPILIALILGVFAEMVQTGVLFAFESLKPSAKKLNVGANAKNMVSAKNMVEFLKNILKVVFLSILIYLVVYGALGDLMLVPPSGLSGVTAILAQTVTQVMIYTSAAYLIVGFFDIAYQRFQHKKQLKMTKDEVKREYKESEGDPLIKGKRKQLHQEMMQNSTIERTRKAKVLVTNPTHIAIALYYEADETPLPVVISAGEGAVAKRMMEVAEQEGIPIMRNVPLARSLYETATVDQFIPGDLIEPVAEILRWLESEATPY
ncbi:type III secretion system export apparatus subunit SctU [Thalassospira sp.]|uniref:type III secretion system export apparatus subunit SctU n=1 Tax=Thalassospira sp. TaxID=1912094 RepID=UPI000C5FED2C|nr:type III secretion system export apparatus subunit SctU [Thalassospira sp.]MBC05407.1 EscU/YscU/HrcU family type III secretion system export apparatus switch protein [Thalassospira sp.]|tara:strand:- start:8544 stop:9587 length:1044 start_codon:yes stop_codon:yes gene_type:complete